MSRGAALMLGIILVVSGPTVVGPLLGFVRPTERLQQVLIADGQLVAVTQTGAPTPQPGDTLVSLGPALAAQPADSGRSELPEVERR